MVDFKKLKSNSGKKSLEALTAELNKISNKDGRSEEHTSNSSHMSESRMPSSA